MSDDSRFYWTDTMPRQRALPYERSQIHSQLEPTNITPSANYEVAVLIPCYNEAITIEQVVRDFREAIPYANIYVYDNNSKDDTAAIAAHAGAIVRLESMQGKGNVMRRMFRDIEADLYILVDGDGTYDAQKAIEMLDIAVAGPFDLVNCIRVTEKGEPAYRKGHQFGNRILTGAVKSLFGNRIEDMLSGYKVLSRRFVKSFPALSGGFEIETELTIHALELQMPIAHVKGTYLARPKGSSSKLNTFRDGRKIGLLILNLFKSEKPFLFFTLISLFLAAGAIALSVPVIITYFDTGLVPRVPTALLSVGVMLVAIISFVCGLILDTVTRGRHEAKMLYYLRIPAARSRS